MKIVVTGASGYVGGRITESLRRHGHEVIAFSRRKTAPPWHPYSLSDDPATLPWSGVDVLVHAAYDFTARTAEEHDARNTKPSIALFDAAHVAGVRKLIHISSMSAFDGCSSHYGKSKLTVENHVLRLGATVLRPGLVWGDQPGGVMGALERLVMQFPVIPCLTGPHGLPQYLIHESDLCNALIQLLNLEQSATSAVIQVASPSLRTIKQILIHIAVRHRLHRMFIPIPWQIALIGLKCAEFVGLSLPFRSDSLVGLVHANTSLKNDEHSALHENYRSFS